METRILDDTDASILADFLAPHIESSVFLRNNSLKSGLVDGATPYHGLYVGAFDGGELVGVAAHYWNGMVILQAPRCAGLCAAAAVSASTRPLAGVIGPLPQALDALATLGVARDTLHADSPEILYSLSLDALARPPDREGQDLEARLPRESDIPQIIEWTLAYDHEAMGIPPTPARLEAVTQNLDRAMAEGTQYVMTDKGALVSMTGFNSEIPGIVQIGGVWTPPSLRGRGYARTIVARHLETARDRGVERAILFTGHDNVPAQRAYEALGFRRIGDYALMILGD